MAEITQDDIKAKIREKALEAGAAYVTVAVEAEPYIQRLQEAGAEWFKAALTMVQNLDEDEQMEVIGKVLDADGITPEERADALEHIKRFKEQIDAELQERIATLPTPEVVN